MPTFRSPCTNARSDQLDFDFSETVAFQRLSVPVVPRQVLTHLPPDITCTMEPLYMIPGRMGFHVEDMYRITPTGFEAITGAITPNDNLIQIG